MAEPIMLELKAVRFGYPGRPAFLGPISVSIEGGRLWGIVGPNGAGKSTLLRLMAGLCRPDAGEVTFEKRPLRSLSARDRARHIALVPQHPPADVDFAVRDVVLLGRFPHRSLGLFESQTDYRVAERAMAITHTLGFADRAMSTLSGGEAQRVHVAAALAQEPQVLLLDEPTASLDLQYELSVFEILRDRACRDGLAVVVVTHDVNLAGRYCTDILLLHDGAAAASGPPREVLAPSVLEPVYGVKLVSLTVPGDGAGRWVVPVGPMGGDAR